MKTEINSEPFDLGDSPAYPDDTVNDSYDAEAVERWWRILRLTDGVLARFASRFNGKASPIHLFWHGLDLAHARFSGRPAPAIEGADRVNAEAYSHELVSFGWWPGDDRSTPYPALYSYTAPEPDTLRDQPLPGTQRGRTRERGRWRSCPTTPSARLPDPAAAVLDFYESAYRAVRPPRAGRRVLRYGHRDPRLTDAEGAASRRRPLGGRRYPRLPPRPRKRFRYRSTRASSVR